MRKFLGAISIQFLLLLTSCGASQLNGQTEVSKCREDFTFTPAVITQALTNEGADAATERLLWAYDKNSKTLSFMHDNLCHPCGEDWELSLILTKDENSKKYSLMSLAKDTSRATANCGNCRYDLKTSATITEDQTIDLAFSKKVVGYGDDKKDELIWSGKLDFAQGSGEIAIKNTYTCFF